MNDKTIIRPGGRPKRSGQTSTPSLSNAFKKDGKPRTSLSDLVKQKRNVQGGSSAGQPAIKNGLGTSHTDDIKSILAPLVLLVSQVKNVQELPNLDELKVTIEKKISELQAANFLQGDDFTASEEVSYGLCCFIDETVLNTPWGAQSKWVHESLLVTFFKETWGGERFFQILDEMKSNPSTYIDAIEVYNVFLELGFEGQYRHQQDGGRILNEIKEENFLLISQYKPSLNAPLSDLWEPSSNNQPSYLKTIPQWVIWTSVLAICLIAFFYLNLTLSNQADPVKRKLVALRDVGAISTVDHAFFQPDGDVFLHTNNSGNKESIRKLLAEELAPEVASGVFAILTVKEGVVVRLARTDLFQSGSDNLASHYIPAIEKLARALNSFDSTIVISGHSDDVPIRTIKYPDNWALSEARAQSVKNIIETKLDKDIQILARGLADTNNLVPNSSPENRAKNRRVEVLIKE